MDGRSNFDDLFAHQDWVRSLAVRLCADGNAADDLVQDTWIEVLEGHGPVEKPRGWLGGVMRHLARRRRTRDAARGEREVHAARSEAIPSADELLAQAELQRRVLSAVAELTPNARQVVLLRFYEGLSAEHIAARLGEPSSTIRNRLARALEVLRRRLDGDYDGERASWAGLFFPALTSQTFQATAGVTLAMKMQIVLGVVVLATAVAWWRVDGSAPSWGAAEFEPTAATIEIPAENTRESVREPILESALEPVAADAAPSFAALSNAVLVHGRIVGPTAQAARQGEFAFFGERGEQLTPTIDDGATYSMFPLTPGRWRVVGWVRGFKPLDSELVITGEHDEVEHDLALVSATALPVKLLDASTGELLEFPRFDPLGIGLGVVATRAVPTRVGGVRGRLALNSQAGSYVSRAEMPRDAGFSAEFSGLLELREAAPLVVSVVMRDTVIASRALTGVETELVFELDRAALEAQLGVLVTRCIDGASGEPIGGVSVDVQFSDGGGSSRGQSDAQGLVRIERLTPGMRTITISAAGFADIDRWVKIGASATLDLGTIALTRPATVRGRTIDAQGQGVVAQLSAIALDRVAMPLDVQTRLSFDASSNGAFELVGIEATRTRLVARAEGFAITTMDLDASSGSVEGLEVRMAPGTNVHVRVAPGVFEGLDVLLVDATGQAMLFEPVALTLPRSWTLAPGTYELRQVVDDEIIRTQALTVGSEPVMVELRPFE